MVEYEIIDNENPMHYKNCIMKIIDSFGHEHDTALHWHNGIELSMVIKGNVTYLCEGSEQTIHEGDLFFVNSDVIHAAYQKDPFANTQVFVLVIANTLLEEILPECKNPYFILPGKSEEYHSLTASIRYLINEMQSDYNSPYHSLLLKKAFFSLLYQLYEHCHVPDNRRSETDHIQIREILQYVNAHYRDDIPVAVIADLFGLQKEYFCKKFRKHTGITYHRYLSRIRLDSALSMLSAGSGTALECALNAGFSSEKVLIDWCRKIYHCTPMQYIQEISA